MTIGEGSDIPSLAGMKTVVTGANSGVGMELSLALARAGAHVVLACRDKTRGQQAADAVRRAVGGTASDARIGFGELDLANLASVRGFASAWTGPLDVLINNAGVMAIPQADTADGFEMQFGVNHLGHFALTNLLMPALQRSATPRVISVSSNAHLTGRINFDDLQSRRNYRRWRAYAQSKLANLLFIRELDRRARAAGSPLVAAAAHPGFARTNLSGGMTGDHKAVAAIVSKLESVLSQTADRAALPALYAATMPGVRGGDYFGPDGPFGARGTPTRVGRSRRSRNDETALWLWIVSEELTGVPAGI